MRPEQAVIGNQLRQLAVWCQLGDCIARHAETDALGEADIRARAVAAGWREDAFSRMVCPQCQQRRPIWSKFPLQRLSARPARIYIGQHRRTA